MQEKDFQTKFNHWANHRLNETAAFELKFAKEKSLAFSRLEEHQRNALFQTKHNKILYKIPDAGYSNPFDGFMLAKANAYVVVMFYVHGQKKFYMIDIDAWINEEKTSTRKSLTEERAACIGKTCELA